MTTKTEGNHTGEFLLSEGNGNISREQVTVAQGATAIRSGTVMGKITASGKYIAYVDAAVDGSGVAAGILFADLPAQTGSVDHKAAIIARSAEVIASKIVGSDANAVTELAALGIIQR